MSREQCLQEMVAALVMGGAAAIIAFVFALQVTEFNIADGISFLFGTWFIGTYCSWSLIDWTERWLKWRRKQGR